MKSPDRDAADELGNKLRDLLRPENDGPALDTFVRTHADTIISALWQASELATLRRRVAEMHDSMAHVHQLSLRQLGPPPLLPQAIQTLNLIAETARVVLSPPTRKE